jgi:hypothetical protein
VHDVVKGGWCGIDPSRSSHYAHNYFLFLSLTCSVGVVQRWDDLDCGSWRMHVMCVTLPVFLRALFGGSWKVGFGFGLKASKRLFANANEN